MTVLVPKGRGCSFCVGMFHTVCANIALGKVCLISQCSSAFRNAGLNWKGREIFSPKHFHNQSPNLFAQNRMLMSINNHFLKTSNSLDWYRGSQKCSQALATNYYRLGITSERNNTCWASAEHAVGNLILKHEDYFWLQCSLICLSL